MLASMAGLSQSEWLARNEVTGQLIPQSAKETLGEHQELFDASLKGAMGTVKTVKEAGGKPGEMMSDIIARTDSPEKAAKLDKLRIEYGEDLVDMTEFDVMKNEVITKAFSDAGVEQRSGALKLINETLDVWKMHTLLSASYPLTNLVSALAMAGERGVSPVSALRNMRTGLQKLAGRSEDSAAKRGVQELGASILRRDVGFDERKAMLGGAIKNIGRVGEDLAEDLTPAAVEEFSQKMGIPAPNFQGIVKSGVDSPGQAGAGNAIEAMGLKKHIIGGAALGGLGGGPAGAAVGAGYAAASFYGIRGLIGISRVMEDGIRHTIWQDGIRQHVAKNLDGLMEQVPRLKDIVGKHQSAWRMSADEVVDEAVANGSTREEGLRVGQKWADFLDDGSKFGEQLSYDSQVNYWKRKEWEDWTATRVLVPFLKWPVESIPFFTRAVLSHPIILRATGDLFEAGQQGWDGFSDSHKKYLEEPTGILAHFLGTEKAGVNVMKLMLPYAQGISDIDREDSLLKQAQEVVGLRFGGPAQPLVALSQSALGMQPAPMQDFMRWTGAFRDLVGVDVEKNPKDVLRGLQSGLPGGTSNTFDEWNVNSLMARIAGEQADKEGLHGEKWARRRDQLYDEAYPGISRQGGLGNRADHRTDRTRKEAAHRLPFHDPQLNAADWHARHLHARRAGQGVRQLHADVGRPQRDRREHRSAGAWQREPEYGFRRRRSSNSRCGSAS